MFVFSFGVLSATRTEHGHSRTRFSDPAFDWAIGLRSYKSSLRQSPLRGHDWSTLRPLGHRPRVGLPTRYRSSRWHSAESVPLSPAGCDERRDDRRHEGNLFYFNVDTD